MQVASRFAFTLGLALATSSCAFAQWYSADIHPGGYFRTIAWGGRGNMIVGWGNQSLGSNSDGLIWIGSGPASVVNPINASNVIIRRTDGWDAVGVCTVNGQQTATMWFGQGTLTASLAPERSISSSLHDLYGDKQVGAFAYDDNIVRAGIWSGTADSVVDIHPGGSYLGSSARGIFDDTQVGGAFGSDYVYHAARWYGSAGSFLDMHPQSFTGSLATDVEKGRACGYAFQNTIDSLTACEAMLWDTSSGTETNINPGRAVASKAWAINSSLVVGYATYDYWPRATLWNLRDNTLIDLQGILDIYNPYLIGSQAFDVWYEGDYVKVCGIGYDIWSGQYRAVIWAGML